MRDGFFKVKSVNLDSWTPEQVQSMRVMGNAKAKAVYEAELPDHFRRPQTDQALESFIRAKYEHKRFRPFAFCPSQHKHLHTFSRFPQQRFAHSWMRFMFYGALKQAAL